MERIEKVKNHFEEEAKEFDRFPNSQISCLDIAENMIKIAQMKLGEKMLITM